MKEEFADPWVHIARFSIPKKSRIGLLSDDARTYSIASPLWNAGVTVICLASSLDYSDGCERLGEPGKNGRPIGARPYHTVTLLLQGEMRISFGGVTHHLTPGDLAICPAFTPFHREAKATPACWIFMQIADVPEWEPLKSHGAYVKKYHSTAMILILLRDLMDAVGTSKPAVVSHGVHCAKNLLELLREEMANAGWYHSPHAQRLMDLLAKIESSPGEKWTLERMASDMHVSERRLSQIFRKELGTSPGKLVLYQRMMKAAKQLSTTDRPIKFIADDLGYDSLHSFTRLFAKHIGLPPGAYRERFTAI